VSDFNHFIQRFRGPCSGVHEPGNLTLRIAFCTPVEPCALAQLKKCRASGHFADDFPEFGTCKE